MLLHRDPPSVRLGHLRESEALREAVFGHDEPPVEWSTPPAKPRPEPVKRIPNEHIGRRF